MSKLKRKKSFCHVINIININLNFLWENKMGILMYSMPQPRHSTNSLLLSSTHIFMICFSMFSVLKVSILPVRPHRHSSTCFRSHSLHVLYKGKNSFWSIQLNHRNLSGWYSDNSTHILHSSDNANLMTLNVI